LGISWLPSEVEKLARHLTNEGALLGYSSVQPDQSTINAGSLLNTSTGLISRLATISGVHQLTDHLNLNIMSAACTATIMKLAIQLAQFH